MQPDLSLDTAILAANARAWRAFAGVPLYAVVKGDGYGWGTGRVVRALEGIAEGYGDRKSTRLNSSHYSRSRMPSSA